MMATAAEDRAWLEHVQALRRVKITLNEDEICALYQLVVAERSDDKPTLLPGLPSHLKHAMSMALVKLSEAHYDLNRTEGGKT